MSEQVCVNVIRLCLGMCVCVLWGFVGELALSSWLLWYFDMGPVCCCESERGSPDTALLGTSLWSHHDGETRHWGGYSTAQQLRESNRAAQTRSSCDSSNRVWWGYACTSTRLYTLLHYVTRIQYSPCWSMQNYVCTSIDSATYSIYPYTQYT